MLTKRRRKPGSATRNVAFMLFCVLFMLGLASAVRVFRCEVVLMLPDEHEARLAKRKSPDNALPILAFAIKALPAKPDGGKETPMYAPKKWWNERQANGTKREGAAGVFELEPDFAKLDEPSLGKLCWVDRNDEDPALVEYIRACQSAEYLVYTALGKPFCVCSEPPRFHSRTYDGSLMQLGRNMAALGRVLFADSPSPASLQPLIDAIRMARLLSREDDLLAVSQSIEGPALQQIRHIAAHTDQAPLLARTLNELGPGYLPRRDVLRALWLELDDQIGPQNADTGPGSYRRRIFRSVVFSYEIRGLVAAMKGRQDELVNVADGPPPAMAAWMCDSFGTRRGPADLGTNERRILVALHRAAELAADFAATQLVLALETCKAETGQYPATLDALVPKHIAAVPQDPYTLAPFGYTLTGGAYVLYSRGEDLVDNGGDPARDRFIAGPGTS